MKAGCTRTVFLPEVRHREVLTLVLDIPEELFVERFMAFCMHDVTKEAD